MIKINQCVVNDLNKTGFYLPWEVVWKAAVATAKPGATLQHTEEEGKVDKVQLSTLLLIITDYNWLFITIDSKLFSAPFSFEYVK